MIVPAVPGAHMLHPLIAGRQTSRQADEIAIEPNQDMRIRAQQAPRNHRVTR